MAFNYFIFMKKIISLLLIFSFLLSSCFKFDDNKELKSSTWTSINEWKYVKSKILSKSFFSEDLKLLWKVIWSKETNISTQLSWIIKTINFKNWDSVRKWDIIAEIDTQTNLTNINYSNILNNYDNSLWIYKLTEESIKKDLEIAKLQYENALLNKNNTYEITEKQLELSKKQLNLINTQKDNISKISNSSLELAKSSLENSKLTLENFLKISSDNIISLETKKDNIYKSINSYITSSLSSINYVLTFIDIHLWISKENKDFNNSYEDLLSFKNPTYKTNANQLYRELILSYKDFFENWKESYSNEEIKKKFLLLEKIINDNINLYNYMTDILDNTIVSVWYLSDITLSSIKSTNISNKNIVLWLKNNFVVLNWQLSDIENSLASLKTANETQKLSLQKAVNMSELNYNNILANSNNSVDNVSSSKDITESQLDNTLSNIKSTRDNVDKNFEIALSQYNSLKAKYDSQLLSSKIQLDNIDWQKKVLEQQISNSYIKVPFDWVITSKNVELWSLVTPWMSLFSISNSKDKIIKVNFSVDNLKNIYLWKELFIKKNENTFSWTVSNISSSADLNTKLFSLEISFKDIKTINSLILWDYVDVYLNTQDLKNKYITIPFSSLIAWLNWSYSVFLIWSWSLAESRKIKIWPSNSFEIVVVDWLKEGDELVISWILNIDNWDKLIRY